MEPLSTTNWIAIGAAVLSAGSVCVAVVANTRTLRQNNRFKRAEWLLTVTQHLHKESRLQKVFNDIQYDRFTFRSRDGSDGDLGSEKELDLVYWLDFLNAISDGVHEKLLTVRHLRSCTLGYAIDKTLENKDVKEYLAHVAAYDLKRKSWLNSWGILKHTHESFQYLRRLGPQYEEFDRRNRRLL